MQDQPQINNSTPVNNTGYPLTGGLRPSSPAFPPEMNPEIHKLQEEIQILKNELQAMTLKKDFLEVLCKEKEEKFQQLLEVHKTVLSSLKH